MNRWVAGARPRTLPAAVVPVALGAACAVGGGAVWWRALPALLVSLALQVGVNYANDYSDGIRGTDDVRVGPVRLVAGGLASPGAVKRAALVAFAVAGVAGLVLASQTSWWLVVVGLAAVAAAWGYTGGPNPYGYLGLGEVFVFVFFGLVATVGAAYVQILDTTWLAVLSGCAMGCLSTALLVVNNLRDIPGDTAVGKRTLAVRLGDRRTRVLYVVLLVLPFVLLPFMAGLGGRPLAALAFVAVVLARPPVVSVLSGARSGKLIGVLADTGRVQLVYGVLLATGLLLVV